MPEKGTSCLERGISFVFARRADLDEGRERKKSLDSKAKGKRTPKLTGERRHGKPRRCRAGDRDLKPIKRTDRKKKRRMKEAEKDRLDCGSPDGLYRFHQM